MLGESLGTVGYSFISSLAKTAAVPQGRVAAGGYLEIIHIFAAWLRWLQFHK